ncbi:MAG: hypothetical protein R3F02_04235 [Thiolinea sp.]
MENAEAINTVFKMVFDGWQVELFKPRLELKKGYLKLEIDFGQAPALRGKTLNIFLQGSRLLSVKMIEKSSIHEISLPFADNGQFELSILMESGLK